MALPEQKADHVFVHCPFDREFKPLFDAIVFTVFDCGFVARSALEMDDSSEVRIDEIVRLIRECKYGIHDISRTELSGNALPEVCARLKLELDELTFSDFVQSVPEWIEESMA